MKTQRFQSAVEDRRFVSFGVSFYFANELVENLKGEELLLAAERNVLETLKTGALGLPLAPEPTYLVEYSPGTSVAILAPPILLLTKMKRWATMSTLPVRKQSGKGRSTRKTSPSSSTGSPRTR
ncbi:hypothetical protein CC2G_002823 [Coprinopsis cinerea AmutBmut pab1-1]|nr:hypothetical protein CC2G_002823 [Coprinopsis cinerea AmutBmut pab1-1]